MEQDYTQLSRRARRLQLAARTLVKSLRLGNFHSMYYGQGIEFCGVRDYLRGDDVRAIDWNVTARLGKPYVKLFSEDRELQIFLVVDRSLSMHTGTLGRTRLDAAEETAELLTLVAEQSSSPVGAVLFSSEIEFAIAPKGGKNTVQLILSELDNYAGCKKRGSHLVNALQGSAKLLRKRALIFVLSDFRVGGWKKSLSFLAGKHDVIALRISDPIDTELPDTGSIPFTDPETLRRVILPTSSGIFRRSWRDAERERTEKWKEDCIRCGGVPLELSTADDPVLVLTRYFSSRERR